MPRNPEDSIFCDLGSLIEVNEWKRHLFNEMHREKRLVETVRTFWRGRAAGKANHHIADMQRDGRYWLHSPAEFAEAVTGAGFSVIEQSVCYRGCSDLVIAKRIWSMKRPCVPSPSASPTPS